MNLDPSSSKALVPRVNKANNLLGLILSKPFVKVIIRVDTSRHGVIIINISVSDRQNQRFDRKQYTLWQLITFSWSTALFL